MRVLGVQVGHDSSAALDCRPLLTTIRQPVNRMVDTTVETMLAQIESPEIPPRQIEIEGKLIVRSSARIPEGWTQ